MPISQQVAHSLEISKLKGIAGLQQIRFDEKPLTAILGPNGCGKSTILHALACCYQPPADNLAQPNHRFRDFFTPTTDSTWAGSSLSLVYSYRDDALAFPNVHMEYRKDSNRWVPRYERRPSRPLAYIGIKTCVPKIEEEPYSSLITYATSRHEESELIMDKMSVIFNRKYVEVNLHLATMGRQYNGLRLEDGTRYSALAMGAGEQRVLYILLVVFTAPKYALILIDEIDLLLHTAALKQLLRILHDRAADKSLQIVFTTHREAVLELPQFISIKHLHTVKGKTYCFSNTKPDAMHRLTGAQHRAIEVFVEDDLAQAIVGKELLSLQMKKFATITQYGAATNCFTLAAGLMLSGNYNFSHQLFLLDGDLYTTEQEQLERTQKALTGTEVDADERRQQVLGAIRKLLPVANTGATPEAQLHMMIRTLPGPWSDEEHEVVNIANDINAVADNHGFVNKIVEALNFDRAVSLQLIAKVASRSEHWPAYVAELRAWLVALRDEFVETA